MNVHHKPMFGAKREEQESKTQDRAKKWDFRLSFHFSRDQIPFLFLRNQTETLATQAIFISIAITGLVEKRR